jgi:hypothetical protein
LHKKDTSQGFLQNDVSNFFMKVFAELFSKSDRNPYYLLASSIATATATVIPTIGLLPALDNRRRASLQACLQASL